MKALLASVIAGTAASASLRSGACATPTVGTPVQSLVCNTPGASVAVNFTQTPNPYTGLGWVSVLGTNPALCFAVSGTIPDDGAPAIALQPCDATGKTPAQLFTFLPDGRVVSGLNGQCLDLESGNKAPNERAELFGCSGNDNQLFAWNKTTMQFTDSVWGYCLGAC